LLVAQPHTAVFIWAVDVEESALFGFVFHGHSLRWSLGAAAEARGCAVLTD
jgi:hypothetical protein